MARIATNTTGNQPIIQISVDTSNVANGTLTIPFIQEVTIKNSTGVYSYTTFTDTDMRKLSTPADNEISTNVVIDSVAYFGNTGATANTAAFYGLSDISINKREISFNVYYAGNANAAVFTTGTGFITNLAPTTSPTAPVWVTPLTIAVDGPLSNDTV